MFDGEHVIALHAMQGNWASSGGEGEVSWFFSSCGRNLGIFSSYGRAGHSKFMFGQRRQDTCLVMRDTSGIYSRFGSAIRNLHKVRQETHVPFPVATVKLGFLSIFNKSQALSPFEALISMCISRCQRDMRPPVQRGRDLGLSLASPQGIQTSHHLVR